MLILTLFEFFVNIKHRDFRKNNIQAIISSSSIKNIINDINSISKNSDVLRFGDQFSNALDKDTHSLQKYVDAFKRAQKNNSTITVDSEIPDASDSVRNYIRSRINNGEGFDNVDDVIDKFKTKQAKSFIAASAEDRSFANVKTLINTYNDGLKDLGVSEKEFSEATKGSNDVLGNYLSKVKSGEATFGGYIKALAATKLETLALSAANAAIAAAVSYVITKISEYFSKLDTLCQKADEARSELESVKSEVSSLESELEKTGNRIDELNGKGKLTLSEKSELEKLKTQNEALEYQYIIKKKIADMKASGAADSAKNALEEFRPKNRPQHRPQNFPAAEILTYGKGNFDV